MNIHLIIRGRYVISCTKTEIIMGPVANEMTEL